MTIVRGDEVLPATADEATRKPSQAWQVWADAHAPSGRRTRWLWVVACPCGETHFHFAGPDGGVKRAACGEVYVMIARSEPGAVAR